VGPGKEDEGGGMITEEYRVVWKRKPFSIDPDGGGGKTEMFDPRPKTRRYSTRRGAEKFMLLLGPEPWRYYAPTRNADDLVCCSGYECGCGGMTYREQSDKTREDMPDIEYVRLEVREIGEWKTMEASHDR